MELTYYAEAMLCETTERLRQSLFPLYIIQRNAGKLRAAASSHADRSDKARESFRTISATRVRLRARSSPNCR
eukprot:6206225-Pleurochrysis_carterae.AAC.4